LTRITRSTVPLRYRAVAAGLGCFCLAGLRAFAASAETTELQSQTWTAGWWGIPLALAVSAVMFGRKRLSPRPSRTTALAEALSRVPGESGPIDPGSGPGFRVSCEGAREWLDPAIEEGIYYIGREAVLNALRHSQARNIEVTLAFRPQSFRLVVRDDGCGIAPETVTGSRGLSRIRDRAERMGGRLRLRSAPRRGTEMELILPGAFSESVPTAASFGECVSNMHS
jgi:hypothetical protein